jgi:(1->4)-alpha-D-glucan 1-alpha-D-glucosylmutase
MSLPGLPPEFTLPKDLLSQISARWNEAVSFPRSTYRLQFHRQFTFQDASKIVPYLHALGISHCYASPYLKARPGSTHGYDIINHKVLNPEIGSDQDFAEWVNALKIQGMSHIADIVPNHMGIVGNENPWWNDVLENGLGSPHGSFFDIAWYASPRPELHEKVLLPVLGDPYGKVLEAGQLHLTFTEGAFTLHYFDHRFPIAPQSYGLILNLSLPDLQEKLGPETPALLEYQSILTAVAHLPRHGETDPAKVAEGQREKEVIKRRLLALTSQDPIVRGSIDRAIEIINGNVKDPHSFDLLDSLLDQQPYRLSFWRVAADEINYRRFFDVNELAALSMEQPEVFAATHEKILSLLAEGKIAGLRIDHPDGLYDPRQYLERLQKHFLLVRARPLLEEMPDFAGREPKEVDRAFLSWLDQVHPPATLYVLVEKILADNEALPEDWQTHGTTGYEFLNMLNGLFVNSDNFRAFTRLYQDWVQNDDSYHEVTYQKKFLILQVAMSSELHILAHQLDRLAQKNRWSRDFTLTTLRHALREVIACFPVYRTYISDAVREADRKVVMQAVNRAKARNPALSTAAFHFVRDMLLLKYPENASDADKEEQRRFVGKFQQVTAPVMAKGVEDTSFYVYNRLVSLNEVGGNPGRFGLSPASLHHFFKDRQARWPYALNTTSTHDTKRSEDVRARLNVFSEIPEEWNEKLWRWSSLNQPQRTTIDEMPVPDPNEEYLLYQTLLGAWTADPSPAEEYTQFIKRIQNYMMKALHEAKVHTSWINPNQEYDVAINRYIAHILDPNTGQPFLQDFLPFQKKIARLGLYNSLAQTLIKFTAPGIPDIYQGNDLLDFSLVDPDNRRPVDYALRQRLLEDLQQKLTNSKRSQLLENLLANPDDGLLKLFITYQALNARQKYPDLFTLGEYLPLEVTGTHKSHVFAFARHHQDHWAIIAVPRLLAGLLKEKDVPPLGSFWQDTSLELPAAPPGTNVFSGKRSIEGVSSLPLSQAFQHFPLLLLMN